MVTHSSILAWKISWTEKPGGLQSMGSLGVGHNRGTEQQMGLWGHEKQVRKWQSTPVFLPGKFHRQSSLGGYSIWGCKESDTTEHACTYNPPQLKNTLL